MVSQVRFPIEKLEEKLRKPDQTDLEFVATIGATRNKLRNWRRYGIRFYSADELAISLGYHPSYFWPEYWDVAENNHKADNIPTQEES